MPFLSVIIPTFNAGKLLGDALKSLSVQTFRNFEVVLMDGLSTDDTQSVFDQYKQQLPPSKFISAKDNGIYDAMNKGLDAARGEWIYIMGADDSIYAPDVFQKVHGFIANGKADVVYGNVFTQAFGGGIYAGEFDNAKLYKQNICHQALFFRKSVFEKVGSFSYRYRLLADWEHNLRWFLSDKITHEYFDIIVANYSHGGASSGPLDKVFFRDRDWNYAMSGRKVLSLKSKVWHVLKEYKGCLRDKDFGRLVDRMIKTPKVILGL